MVGTKTNRETDSKKKFILASHVIMVYFLYQSVSLGNLIFNHAVKTWLPTKIFDESICLNGKEFGRKWLTTTISDGFIWAVSTGSRFRNVWKRWALINTRHNFITSISNVFSFICQEALDCFLISYPVDINLQKIVVALVFFFFSYTIWYVKYRSILSSFETQNTL